MSLHRYRAKRDLKRSSEPKAKLHKRVRGELRFVIQKHDATRLHYDFRLELDGVLKSWAVPKGPSLDPTVKRLAVQVEDHPYDYRNFEGVIPEGYGAGTVMIWDQGTYSAESEEAMRSGLKKGVLHFTLKGEKLKGRFSLIKLKSKENEWIWVKSDDEYASREDILAQDRSVVSSKSLNEIAGKKSEKPRFIKPMQATLVDSPFDDKEWLFEIKLDGFRAIADLENGQIRLYSRNLKSFNQRFPVLVDHLKRLKLNAIMDGEIVVLDEKGLSHFDRLQYLESEENLFFFVFDLLFLNDRDMRHLPLLERKALLKKALKQDSKVIFLDHIENQGKKFFKLCQKEGLEGIIGKKKTSSYQSGLRSPDWVKIKADLRQEFVIGGFTEPRKSRKNLGALLVGVYKNGELIFAGHVGGGFTEKKLEEVRKQLEPLITNICPFKERPETNSRAVWVKPKLICEVKFKTWTEGGILRMPIFLGLREDKPAPEVRKEKSSPQYDFLTHLEKIFWPEEGITKHDLIRYYEWVAPFILPYLKDRPETLKRFPNGIDKPRFYQKNVSQYPSWLETIKIEHHDKTVNYLIIQDTQSLLYAVNLGCIELHPWFSRKQSLNMPDFLMFDLDPVDIPFDAVVETAQAIRQLLDSLEVPTVCKTSGGRGMHIGIPLGAKYTYDQAKHFAELIALYIQQQLPDITSLERIPANRKHRVYIDCYQNNYGQTLAAPYSVRAKPGAPISTPLDWSEVRKGITPFDYTLFNLPQRLKKWGDLFKPLLERGINMKKVLDRLAKKSEKGHFILEVKQ